MHNKIGRAGGEIVWSTARGSRRTSAWCPGRRQCAEASGSAISHQPRMQPHPETRGTSRAAPSH
eukprot:6280532-Prymnesium_polylepis.1